MDQLNTKILRIGRPNATFQEIEALQRSRSKRHRSQTFFLEGVRAIEQALAFGWTIQAWIYDGGRPLSDWAKTLLSQHPAAICYELSNPLMQQLSRKNDASELAALVGMRVWPWNDGDKPPFLALFDRPSNKGNLGNILRSADSFGVQGILWTGHAVDPYDPEVIAASMGSFFSMPLWPVARREDLAQKLADLRERWPGFCVVGTSAHAKKPVFEQDLTRPLLLLLGNEKEGLSAYSRSLCDAIVDIPMHDRASASSLNVASAAAILFYEVARQRQTGGEKP